MNTAVIHAVDNEVTHPSHVRAAYNEARKAIGAALAYGKTLHPSTKAFGQWVIENGFGDIPVRTRSAAMEMVAVTGIQFLSGDTHPVNIMAAPLVDASTHIETPEAAHQATREQVWRLLV